MTPLEKALFEFFDRKYVQRATLEQLGKRLQYMEAETHDLAKETARFVTRYLGIEQQ